MNTQTEQELLEIALKSRVATFETSKKLDWQNPTEKVWVQKFDGTFEVMTLKELAYETRNIDEYDGIGYSEKICPAPSFEEVWEQLTEDYRHIITNRIGRYNIFAEDFNEGLIHDGVSIIDNHLSEAAALLFLELKKENRL